MRVCDALTVNSHFQNIIAVDSSSVRQEKFTGMVPFINKVNMKRHMHKKRKQIKQ